MAFRDILGKVGEWGKYHVVDTTALLTATNPIYSTLETVVSGMSDDVSINAPAYSHLGS